MVKLLVDSGANINHQSNNGDTPLHTNCADPDSIDVIEELLKLGADPNIKNKLSKTPHDIAIGREEFEIARTLKSN